MNWNEKTVVVIGGNGFLGSRIVSFLKKKVQRKFDDAKSKERVLYQFRNK